MRIDRQIVGNREWSFADEYRILFGNSIKVSLLGVSHERTIWQPIHKTERSPLAATRPVRFRQNPDSIFPAVFEPICRPFEDDPALAALQGGRVSRRVR